MDYVSIIKANANPGPEITGSKMAADGQAFEKAMQEVRDKASGRRDMVKGVLDKNNLSAGLGDSSFSFKRGYMGTSEAAESFELAKGAVPASYQKQLGVGMMAMGQTGFSAGSMRTAASMMNSASSAEALRDVFGSLGAARSHFKLDQGSLDDLGQILSDSGLSEEDINNFLAGALEGGLTVDDLYNRLEKLNLKPEDKQGLMATEAALATMGQVLSGLGASPEVVASITSGFKAGEKLSAADMRQLLTASEEDLLTPCLNQTDVYNLASMLKSMGASQKNLDSLSTFMEQNQGRMTMNDFFNFMEGMEASSAKTVTGEELKLVKNILENITRDQQLAKTPVFDETLLKLQALGDHEIDDNFIELSPALQALRGGISGASQNESFGGQGGQGGKHGGQSGHHNGRESKEQFRQAVYAQNIEGDQTTVARTAEPVQSYGGQDSLARQISQKMAYSHRRGIHRLKMKLNPGEMGQLDIELKVSGGQLVAHIRAENRSTYDSLAEDMESLKTALADSGLEISHLTLAFDDQASGKTEFADLKTIKESGEPLGDPKEKPQKSANDYQGTVYRVM